MLVQFSNNFLLVQKLDATRAEADVQVLFLNCGEKLLENYVGCLQLRGYDHLLRLLVWNPRTHYFELEPIFQVHVLNQVLRRVYFNMLGPRVCLSGTLFALHYPSVKRDNSIRLFPVLSYNRCLRWDELPGARTKTSRFSLVPFVVDSSLCLGRQKDELPSLRLAQLLGERGSFFLGAAVQLHGGVFRLVDEILLDLLHLLFLSLDQRSLADGEPRFWFVVDTSRDWVVAVVVFDEGCS